jgi:rare lipoprotein A
MNLRLLHKPKSVAAVVLSSFLTATSIVPSAQASRGDDSARSTPQPDISGRKRSGIASFYAHQFFGRVMADGTPMDPDAPNAASRTLPLGTTARVTNIETGRSAVVTIQDRGPYAKGRLVDLSPRTARKIGITARKGVAKVIVTPITVPLPNGGIKLGAAAYEPVVARY